MKINRLALASAMLMASGALSSRAAFCAGDIVCSARFYVAPRRSKGQAASHYHLFRINADGSGRCQITSGAHDDGMPQWSPDGRRIVFARDEGLVCVVNADGSGLRSVLNVKSYVGPPQWSPDGREIVLFDSGSNTLRFINARTGASRSLRGVRAWALSPDKLQLAWSTTDNKLWVANFAGASRTVTSLDASTLAWAGPQVLVAATSKKGVEDGGELDGLVVLDTAPGHTAPGVIKRLPIHARLVYSDGSPAAELDAADPRSELMPVKGAPGSFTFRWDNSTSSGQDGLYFRAGTQTGALKLVAEGQFLAWAPGGRRFCWAPYHELSDYNAPGQRKRLVYTSPLKVSDGRTPRTLISGLVLIAGCDWR